MADIKIKRTAEGTTFEASGVDYIDKEVVGMLFNERCSPCQVVNCNMEAGAEFDPFADFDEPESEGNPADKATLRRVVQRTITPDILKRSMEMEELDKVLPIRSQIDVPLVGGGFVTVECGYVTPTMARFVFLDCWDEGVMNEENTNKTGYYGSYARKHVLEDILPQIAPEWRELMAPRKLSEVIDGKKVEYADPMWLPSATDMFGPSNGRWWNDETDSFKMEIFKRERERIKELGDKGTYPQWLRSVDATYSYSFCCVYPDGSADDNFAYSSGGFAPGFDIAAHDSE